MRLKTLSIGLVFAATLISGMSLATAGDTRKDALKALVEQARLDSSASRQQSFQRKKVSKSQNTIFIVDGAMQLATPQKNSFERSGETLESDGALRWEASDANNLDQDVMNSFQD